MNEMTIESGATVLNPASDPDLRRRGIGGSDIPVILGLSPYKTPLDLYLEKRGLWHDEFASEAAHWGNVMEPVLAAEYVQRYEVPVLRHSRGFTMRIAPGDELGPDVDTYDGPLAPLLGTLVHPEYSWARGHVDGIGLKGSDPSHVCEFKTADLRLEGLWGEEDSDQVPEAYLAQVQWYLMLAGLGVAHVAVLIGGNRFRRYIIERDEVLIGLMLERAASFWEMVLRGDPPAPEPGERGKESLARLYPRGHDGKELDADSLLLQHAGDLHRIRTSLKLLEEKKTTVENEIKLVMADAVRLNLGPKSYLSWKNNKDSTATDWKAVAEELFIDAGLKPEHRSRIVEAHTSTKPGPRVFRCQGLDKLFD